MIPLTDILDKVRDYHRSADTELIHRAYGFASQAHSGQMRKSGDPYFVHPVGVAGIIADLNLDTASICAALLHDVVEDCDYEEEDLAKEFGSEVAFLVAGVTKLGKVHFQSREDRQAESFRKMLLAMSKDIRVLLVKLADRLDNMRSLSHMKEGSQERISQETMEIFAPLAGRLGIQWLKDELEDLSFQYLYPESHKQLTTDLQTISRDSDRYVQSVIDEITNTLAEQGVTARISGRLKHPYSIYRKMKKQQVEFERIHDLIAFRVVVEEMPSCYSALGIVHSRWTPVPGRFKDYIALPKSNMYQSLHTTVIGPKHKRVEVQIRTDEMHRTAELGIAAHWQYKESGSGPGASDAEKFSWLRELIEFQQEVKDPEEFFDGVKVDLFHEEVYVFTPDSDVRVFPTGATPVDFAYAIHSEVGQHCTGARVNGSIVPLRYKLHNGDIVDILTSPKQKPSKDWLNFVITARARSRIRGYIRNAERERSEKLGKDLLERHLRKRDLSYGRLLKSGALKKAAEELQLNNVSNLLSQVGFGQVSPEQLTNIVAPDQKSVAPKLRQSLIEKTVHKIRPKDGGVVIGNINDVMVRFGRCCNPVPGDPVTGWITRGRGVTVHRRGCERALELEPERRIDCRWGGAKEMALPMVLRVVTADRPGILAQVSRQFNESGVNITEATCRASVDGRAVNTFQFTIGGVDELRSLTRKLQRVDGIFEVERV